MVNVGKEVAALERMTVGQLRQRYAELFHETTRACNRQWLVRRIIWRLQSLESGGLTPRAQQRADELASTSDLRVTAPRTRRLSEGAEERTKVLACRIEGGSRLPLPGTLLTRCYKGRQIQIQVVADGFVLDGELYKSLSAVAKKITGSHWNGYEFFHLGKGGHQ